MLHADPGQGCQVRPLHLRGLISALALLAAAQVCSAADFGYYGTPRPGSRTDAQGSWTWTSPPIPAAFLGRTLFAEALIVDPAARNGAFHQSRLWSLPVLP